MTNKWKARPPGDVGNATTFSYPVRFLVVPEAAGDSYRRNDRSLLEPFLRATRELEAAGVLAITTTCGFIASFQQELSSAVSVPVFTSSLIQLPLVYEMYGRGGKIGVISAEGSALSPLYFEAVGAGHVPVVIAGMERQPAFWAGVLGDGPELDFDGISAEMACVAQKMVAEHPDLRAFVFECANMAPYARAVQQATGLPVFDIVTLCNMVYTAVESSSYPLVDLRYGRAWWRAPN